jgi:hypothetical protein
VEHSGDSLCRRATAATGREQASASAPRNSETSGNCWPGPHTKRARWLPPSKRIDFSATAVVALVLAAVVAYGVIQASPQRQTNHARAANKVLLGILEEQKVIPRRGVRISMAAPLPKTRAPRASHAQVHPLWSWTTLLMQSSVSTGSDLRFFYSPSDDSK